MTDGIANIARSAIMDRDNDMKRELQSGFSFFAWISNKL